MGGESPPLNRVCDLKRLGASPLTKLGLIAGKTAAALVVALGHTLLLAGFVFALGTP